MICKLALALLTGLMAVVVTRAQLGVVRPNNVPGLSVEVGVGVGHKQKPTGSYATPRYRYHYGVDNHLTGDTKTASEYRDGNKVRGHYSLREADGSFRHVTYVSDHKGFRANVQRTSGLRG